MKQGLLQNYHQRWKEWFETLSVRERMLFLVSIIAVLYMAWDMVLVDRLHKQQKTSMAQLKKWKQQISDIDARIQSVTAELSGSKQQDSQRRIAELKTQIDDFNRQEKNLVVAFIRPTQMVDVLKGLLANEKGLRLKSLQSKAAQPLINKPAAEKKSTDPGALIHGSAAKAANSPPREKPQSNKPASGTSPREPSLPEVYQHGLEVVFQGDYNSTLSYLKKLEQLHWKFYWDEVTYEVLQYPKAQISVRIHTLSLEKGWIGV